MKELLLEIIIEILNSLNWASSFDQIRKRRNSRKKKEKNENKVEKRKLKYKEWIDKKEKDEDWYTYIFGDALIKNDLSEMKSSELSSGSGKIIGLYFSDNKFSECLKFTSKLISIYEQNKRQENKLEVVLISDLKYF